MILSRVRIKNFRCFGNEGIDIKLGRLNLIIGENNSGKTSFLDAIKLSLSRGITRKNGVFSFYDHHISSNEENYPSNPLSIVLTFSITGIDNLPEEYVQTLSTVLQVDGDQSIINLKLKSSYNNAIKDFEYEYSFLDKDDNELPSNTKRNIYDFLFFHPFFYLHALRDAEREFSKNSGFWSAFVKSPDIPEDKINEFQEKLESLNEEVIASNTLLSNLISHISKAKDVLSSNDSHNVSVSAIPGRVSDLFSRAQVNLTTNTGIKIPLEKHGSGTQTLAVIFLFEAYINTILSGDSDQTYFPVLTLEEPEAHLHPSALRALWRIIKDNKTQQILTSHSGDLLSKVDIDKIIKFKATQSGTEVYTLNSSFYTNDELRKIYYHIQSSKGSLLYSRVWILVEGETEFWTFLKISELESISLSSLGIEVIQHANCGIAALLKLSINFGINCIVLSDGDQQGINYSNKAKEFLPEENIFQLDEDCIELYFCENGFGDVYESQVSDQKRHLITVSQAEPDYWKQVWRAQNNISKIEKCLLVMDKVEESGEESQLPIIKEIIKKAESLI